MSSAREIIEEFLARLGIAAEVEERTLPDLAAPYLNILTDEARFLLGSHAATLAALDYLAKRLAEKALPEEERRFFLDVNGYRLHQLEELRAEARTMARKVRLYRTELVLKPMPPFERRIVHVALAEYPDITTVSVGEGPSRRVVIKPYP